MKLEFQNYSTLAKYAFENRYNDFQNTKYQIPITHLIKWKKNAVFLACILIMK